MAVGPFTVSKQRARVVAFTTPFMEDQGGFVIHRPKENDASPFRFFRPFAFKVWCVLGGAILCVGTILFAVDHVAMYSNADPEVMFCGLRKLTVYWWIVYGDFLDQSKYRVDLDKHAKSDNVKSSDRPIGIL